MTVGPNNRLTDVAGVRVGHAEDSRLASGVTAIVFDQAVVAAVDVRGGGPGTRETDLLDPAMTVGAVDAIALAGGSAFGLDAAAGVQAFLRENGRGFAVGPSRVPIVPGAILFDLNNGGDKDWGRYPPYRELGYAAAVAAASEFALGTVGAGYGATTVNLKGGVGTASAICAGVAVAALAVVNAAGSAIIGQGPSFWAAPFEQNGEFGGRGTPCSLSPQTLLARMKGTWRTSTTLVVVVTDAALTAGQAKRLAVMAQDGLARALYPVHTPLDGDVVFVAATAARALDDPIFALAEIGNAAAATVARAVARGVFEAAALPFPGALPSWRDLFA